jgi:hypothetical protein
MKIYTDGAKHWGGQLPRIEEGFKELRHNITPYISEADLVYSNNPWWDQIIKDKNEGKIKGKIILNVLDVPVHLQDYDVKKLQAQLHCADAITSISAWTSNSVERYCGLPSKIIYNPIKPVGYKPEIREKPFFKFAHVGRRYDQNKRASVGFFAVQILGFTSNDVCLIGNESGWGNYMGVINDNDLNTVYNSVDFVLATGKIEGIGLPAIEAMACGAIPVLCNDLTTLEEFFPKNIFPEYHEVEPNPPSVARFIARYINNSEAMQEMKLRLLNHYNKNWMSKFSGYSVARSIIDTYDSIK